MKSKYLLTILIFLLTLSPVFASYFNDWYQWLRIPPEYTKAPDLLYFLILPFLGVFIISWGILTKVNIFGDKLKRINMLLALIFAISSIYYGWTFKVVHFLFGIGSFFAFIVYALLFFIGTKMFAKKQIKSWGSDLEELKDKEKELKEKKEFLKKRQKDLAHATDEQRQALNTEITELKTEISGIEQRIDALRNKIKVDGND